MNSMKNNSKKAPAKKSGEKIKTMTGQPEYFTKKAGKKATFKKKKC